MGELAGRVAVITGGTGGLGQSVSLSLARAGADCHLAYQNPRHRETLEQMAHAESLPIAWHEIDVTDAGAVEGFYRDLDALGRPIGCLLNLAGGFEMAAIDQTRPETWQGMLAINATSAFLNCREAVIRMKPRKQGRIITVSAASVLAPPAQMTAYAASKAAVLALTQSLARELKHEGITVNAILPSIIDTPANRQAMPNADFSRWVKPEQIAQAILFLLSDEASAITGAALPF